MVMNRLCCVQELQGHKEGVSIATAVQHLPADDTWLEDIQQQVYPDISAAHLKEAQIGLGNLSKALHTAKRLAASRIPFLTCERQANKAIVRIWHSVHLF